ncbi:MAG: FAD-binding oxidoreductase [Planctomycetota bacterium]|nr:MAG: FAD-binding oxidoreductase [Planctomycetota bacterium]
MDSKQVVILGGGMAGAATAYFLTQMGVRDILLLEREKDPGIHSTGRNAAILRSAIATPALHALAQESLPFFRNPPPGFSQTPLLDPVGLILAAPQGQEASLDWLQQEPQAFACRPLILDQVYDRIPFLAKHLGLAFEVPDEGVLDVHALLLAFLHGARQNGAEIRFGTTAQRLRIQRDRVVAVETSTGSFPTEAFVDAGGGWAGQLAASAGYPLAITPKRRHLLVTNPLPEVNPRWPVVWLQGDDFYFRPESGGLLLSACDVTEVRPEEGEFAQTEVMETIAEKCSRWLPDLGDAQAAHFWAGMRTFADDESFILGPDPRLQGLYWLAGLGGHGITCGPAAGQRLAAELAGQGNLDAVALALRPDRLLSVPTGLPTAGDK